MPRISRICAGLGCIGASFFASCGDDPEAVREPEPSPLNESLARVAAEVLPDPALASASIRLRAEQGAVAAQVERVGQLAARLGGATLPPLEEDGATLVLARLPAASVPEFYLTLTGTARPAAVGESTSLVEVLIGPDL